MKKILILLTLIVMGFIRNAGAVNVITKISNPNSISGQTDGINSGGDRENSFSGVWMFFSKQMVIIFI